MKRLKVRAHANKDAWQTASECTRLVDEVRRMPKLEELKVSFESLEEVFSCTFNSEGKVDESARPRTPFSVALFDRNSSSSFTKRRGLPTHLEVTETRTRSSWNVR